MPPPNAVPRYRGDPSRRSIPGERALPTVEGMNAHITPPTTTVARSAHPMRATAPIPAAPDWFAPDWFLPAR
jgi:hypothetical protein